MSLRRIFEELYTATDGGTSETREARRTLEHGATILVRRRGRERQVVLGRPGAPVGLVELDTFRVHGAIPDHAEGTCYLPTASGWYYVAYRWADAPSLFDEGL
jgi:hypothetical protein